MESQVVSITSSIPVSHTIPQPAPGTDMLNSPTFCLSHYLYRSALITALFNKQYIAFVYFLHYSLLYMFVNDMLHPYTMVRQVCQGLQYPLIWCEKSIHFHKVRHPELIALCALAPNRVFGQMLGLPGSYVLVPYVPLYRLR